MKRLSDVEAFDKLTKSECYQNTVNSADKNKVNKARAGTNPTTPSSLIGQVAAELGLRAYAAEQGQTTPPPPPVDPPPPDNTKKRYAPRTHNTTSRGNARYCMKPEYGVVDHGSYFEDEMGVRYSKEPSGLDDSGLRDDSYIVPGLKGSDSMDGLEPCDSYTIDGHTYPPYPGDPYLQTGSYHR